MPAPRSLQEMFAWYDHEISTKHIAWKGLCQKSVHTAWGIGSLFASAWAQWNGAAAGDKHPGGTPADAPVGAALCFKGSGVYGHIATKVHDQHGVPYIASNDLVVEGRIDKVPASWPTTHWGQGYLGYLTAVNNYDLNLTKPAARPKPQQGKKYAAIEAAINRLNDSLGTAKAQHDAADVKVLTDEIARLQKLHSTLRRA